MLKTYHTKNKIEVGCDEAGRGCLAGPVVASAVILPCDFNHELLNDSKKLSKKQREHIEPIIIKKSIEWGVGIVSNKEIDKINILNASFLAMHKAIRKITSPIDLLLIDGNRFKKFQNKKHICIIKGDSKYTSIAAASILAKNHRDRIMNKLNSEFPNYKWNKNKGYPTKEHREVINKDGVCKYHRKSFNLFERQYKLDL